MTGRQRTRASSTTNAARMALAGVAVGLGALVLAAPALADPEVPIPPPGAPDAPPAPGQPVIVAADDPAPPPAPPPVGAPIVPEVANQVYGSGKSSGPLGFLRDAWHQAQDPYGFQGMAPGEIPAATPPPPGAGAAPPLPPGYQSLTDPASNGAPVAAPHGGRAAPASGLLPAERTAATARVLRGTTARFGARTGAGRVRAGSLAATAAAAASDAVIASREATPSS